MNCTIFEMWDMHVQTTWTPNSKDELAFQKVHIQEASSREEERSAPWWSHLVLQHLLPGSCLCNRSRSNMYSFGLALQSNLDKVLSCNLFFSGFYAFDLITICPARTTALVPTKAKLSIVINVHVFCQGPALTLASRVVCGLEFTERPVICRTCVRVYPSCV